MAATVIAGHLGNVKWIGTGGAVANMTTPVTRWTVSMICETHDVTGMATDTVARDRLAGLKSWTATVECVSDDVGYDAEFPEGTIVDVEFWLTSTATDGHLDGTGIVTGYSPVQSPDDAGRVTFNITGTTSIVWDTT